MTASDSHHERFSEMTRMLFDRSLQEDFNQTTPAPAPSFGGDNGGGFNPPAPSPTTPGAPSSEPQQEESDFERAKPLIFLIVVLLALFIMYKMYRTCRHRRDQYLMRLRSVQADQVLGDMQMVPGDDPDAELL